jgi:hypothetical protein
MLLKYMCIYFLKSQVIANDVKQGVREFFVYAEFQMVNLDISLSLLRVYLICVDGCLIYIGVNSSLYVPKLQPFWKGQYLYSFSCLV